MTTLAAAPKAAKTTLLISFVLIFLCGAVSGALVMNMRLNHGPRTVVRDKFSSHHEVERLHTALNLSDEQTRQLQMILDDVAVYYDHVLADGQSRVMQILNDDQKQKFKELVEKESH
jgi:hypothetical protein